MFRDIFSKGRKRENDLEKASSPFPVEDGPVLSQDVTFGSHFYRRAGEVAEVVFFHRRRGIRRVLVDNDGYIRDFPGFAEPEELVKHLEDGCLPDPRVCFRTSFCRNEEGFLMIWEVQPDGRYWEDGDGYGGTSDPEVRLCAQIDEEGRFTGPFRLYKVGTRIFREEGQTH